MYGCAFRVTRETFGVGFLLFKRVGGWAYFQFMKIRTRRAIRLPVRFRDAAGCAKLRGPYTLTNERTGPIRLMRDALDIFNSTRPVMRAMKLAPRFEARKSAQYGGDGGFASGFIAAGDVEPDIWCRVFTI